MKRFAALGVFRFSCACILAATAREARSREARDDDDGRSEGRERKRTRGGTTRLVAKNADDVD